MKLIQYPEIHCALRDAFFANFEPAEYGPEPAGILRIEIEERERIKHEMIMPVLDEYGHFLTALKNDDDDTIEEFEAYAESVTRDLERQFVEWMKRQLR